MPKPIASNFNKNRKPIVIIGIESKSGKIDRPNIYKNRFISFEYITSDEEIGLVKLRFNNDDYSLFDDERFQKGRKLKITFGYATQNITLYPMEITEMRGDETLEIWAQSLDIKMTLQKQKSVEDFPLIVNRVPSSRIVEFIWENSYLDTISGLRLEVTNDVFVPKPHPGGETDYTYLKLLAENQNPPFVFFVKNNIVHWHSRDYGKRPVFEYTRGVSPSWLTFRIQGFNDTDSYSSGTEVSSYDIANNKTIKSEANDGTEKNRPVTGQSGESKHGVPEDEKFEDIRNQKTGTIEWGTAETENHKNVEEKHSAGQSEKDLKKEAGSKFRMTEQAMVEAEFKIIGEPRIAPTDMIRLNNISKKISMNYYVKEVIQKISGNSGFTTELKLNANGTKNTANSTTSLSQNVNNKKAKNGKKKKIIKYRRKKGGGLQELTPTYDE